MAQIEANAAAQSQGSTEQTSQAEPSPEQKKHDLLSGRHRVNWNGAEREVDIDDLVKKAAEYDQAQTLSDQAKALLRQSAAYEAFGQVLESMTPSQQQAMQAILQNPAMLERLNGQARPQSKDEDSVGSVDDIGSFSEPKQSPNDEALAQRLQQMEQGLTVIAKHLSQEVQQKATQTRAQQVESKINEWGVFKDTEEGKTAARLAKRMVLAELAVNPQVNVEKLVAELAAQNSTMLGGARKGAVVDAMPGVGRPRNDLVNLTRTPTGDDLLNGDLLDASQQLYKQLTGR